jgi:glycosyltransferase involved in cell wall biosynthesis
MAIDTVMRRNGKGLRIGVDACCWANRRGFGRFTRELLTALARLDKGNEYTFFMDGETAENSTFPTGIRLEVVRTEMSPMAAASASGRRSLKDLWLLSRQVMKTNVDLFFFPAVYSYFPILNRCKIVVTIHDMIADHHPERVFPSRKLMLFWKLKQNLALRQADKILTVSGYSKRQIVQHYNIPETRVAEISEGPSDVFRTLSHDHYMDAVLRRYGLKPEERFLLYVGGISPHKNLDVLVEAYHRLTMDLLFEDVKLVLVGDYQGDAFYSHYPAIKGEVEKRHLTEKVLFTGFVPDDDLAYLYNAAILFVLPSLEEGFGLPAIEAMACGTPVVASDRGSLPEVLGEAGCFFDPSHSGALLTVLRNVVESEEKREHMRRSGIARSKLFTWEEAARKTVSLFSEITE